MNQKTGALAWHPQLSWIDGCFNTWNRLQTRFLIKQVQYAQINVFWHCELTQLPTWCHSNILISLSHIPFLHPLITCFPHFSQPLASTTPCRTLPTTSRFQPGTYWQISSRVHVCIRWHVCVCVCVCSGWEKWSLPLLHHSFFSLSPSLPPQGP